MKYKKIWILLSIFILTIALNYYLKSSKSSRETTNLIIEEKIASPDQEMISPISINYLRSIQIKETNLKIEQELSKGSNYKRFLVSYYSDEYKIFGLLTIPNETNEQNKAPVIIFNHGYIPPTQYKTEEKYVAYVDYLARNGFIVFKIDLRGHGNSEGTPTGTYFSNAYTIDVLSALKSIRTIPEADITRIGLWGHSMSGNLVLRSMLISDEIKAGVIWAGAVYSYKDFAEYGISDNSYRRNQPNSSTKNEKGREQSPEIQILREKPELINFDSTFWKSISLTHNLNYLNAPIQLHHSIDDNVVNIGYSRDLYNELIANNKAAELFEYNGGGHNIDSPYFEQAMKRSVDFFRSKLNQN